MILSHLFGLVDLMKGFTKNVCLFEVTVSQQASLLANFDLNYYNFMTTPFSTLSTKDSTIYHLKQRLSVNDLLMDTGVYFSNDWSIQPDSGLIVLNNQRACKQEEDSRNPEEMVIRKDTTIIIYDDINNISIERTDIGKTALLLESIIVTLVGLMLLVIVIRPNPHRI